MKWTTHKSVFLNVIKSREVIYFMFLLYLVFQFVTLTMSPLPWSDETFYASITLSYQQNHKFYLDWCPICFDFQQILTYGPIYFMINSIIISIFGFGIFQFRILGLLSGIGCIYISMRIMNSFGVSKNWIHIFASLLALDTVFNQSMRSGRMDTLALFFVLTAYYIMFTYGYAGRKNIVIYLVYGVSALIAAAALLTTPRTGYLLLFFPLFHAYRSYRERKLSHLIRFTFWATVLASTYYVWLLYAFGDIGSMLNYYKGIHAEQYIGGNFHINIWNLPLLIIFCLCCVLIILCNNNKKYVILLTWCIMNTLLYFSLVANPAVENYMAFCIPFIYMLIIFVLNNVSMRKWFVVCCISILFLINITIFGIRSTICVVRADQRDSGIIDEIMAEYIPEGSRVLGDNVYFYSVRKNGGQFRSVANPGKRRSVEVEMEYYGKKYNFDYMILNDKNWKSNEVFNGFCKEFSFEVVKVINTDKKYRGFMAMVNEGLRKFGNVKGYDGVILRRLRDS